MRLIKLLLVIVTLFLVLSGSLAKTLIPNEPQVAQTNAFQLNQASKDQVKNVDAAAPSPKEKTKVFIVHGRNVEVRKQVYDMLQNIGYEPVVLYERVNNGDTIIEKLEREVDKCKFGIVIMSPDNIAYTKAGDGNQTISFNKMAYPRLNVIFEFGLLIGKYGRQNVIYLNVPYDGVQSAYDLPSDLLGYVWINYDDQLSELQTEIKNGNYGKNK